MKIERKSIKEQGSCSFCEVGTYFERNGSPDLHYDYKHVTVVTSDTTGVSYSFCDDCLQELINHISEEEE